MALQQIERLRIGRLQLGAALAGAVVLVQLAAPGFLIYAMVKNPNPPGIVRAQMVERLRATSGDHLVLVEYSDAPQQLFEWVYNDADIDRSRVIFARPIDDAGRRRLLAYYPKRRVWRLFVDGTRFSLDELPR